MGTWVKIAFKMPFWSHKYLSYYCTSNVTLYLVKVLNPWVRWSDLSPIIGNPNDVTFLGALSLFSKANKNTCIFCFWLAELLRAIKHWEVSLLVGIVFKITFWFITDRYSYSKLLINKKHLMSWVRSLESLNDVTFLWE